MLCEKVFGVNFLPIRVILWKCNLILKIKLFVMFTGIITHTTTITSTEIREESLFVEYKKPVNLNLSVGASVSVDGVCSTVRSFDDESWVVEYMPETLRLTTVGSFQVGQVVNLEATLTLGSELSGHMVQGHVDSIGSVIRITQEGLSWVMTIKAPEDTLDYMVHKGSIAMDGISLTISALDEGLQTFSVSLIEHTLDHTNLRHKEVGSSVNLEVDIIGKYLKKFVS